MSLNGMGDRRRGRIGLSPSYAMPCRAPRPFPSFFLSSLPSFIPAGERTRKALYFFYHFDLFPPFPFFFVSICVLPPIGRLPHCRLFVPTLQAKPSQAKASQVAKQDQRKKAENKLHDKVDPQEKENRISPQTVSFEWRNTETPMDE